MCLAMSCRKSFNFFQMLLLRSDNDGAASALAGELPWPPSTAERVSKSRVVKHDMIVVTPPKQSPLGDNLKVPAICSVVVFFFSSFSRLTFSVVLYKTSKLKLSES